jgi:hypothetical protein
MKHQMAFPLLAVLAVGGCSAGDASNPIVGKATARAELSSELSSPRSGEFHATKECSSFHRKAGQFCTITSSNLKAIPVGTTVTYLSDAGPTALDTDVILDPPGPGNNQAYGHVFLSFSTLTGRVTITGGTGKFSKLNVDVVVTHLTGVNWAWDGTYNYTPPE